MITKKAVNFRGTFKGIYEWGVGYVSTEVMTRWNEFWIFEFPKSQHFFWNCHIGRSYVSLVGIGKAVYMHPMTISGTFVNCGCVGGIVLTEENHRYEYMGAFHSEISELIEICEECAKYCGGEFIMEVSREFDIETPTANIQVTDENDYLHKCSEVREVRF